MCQKRLLDDLLELLRLVHHEECSPVFLSADSATLPGRTPDGPRERVCVPVTTYDTEVPRLVPLYQLHSELRSGFSSLSYSDCCLYFSKRRCSVRRRQPKSQRAEEESKEVQQLQLRGG